MRRIIDADGWARHAAGANGFSDVGMYAAFAPATLQPPMYFKARVERAHMLGDAIVAACRAVGRGAQRAWAAWRQWRAAREVYASLSDLDDRTLHDLGIDRSELTSVAREASGQAEYTRAHVLASSFGVPR